MKAPIEYGDNFPVVPSESWNPAVPWRFPQHEIRLKPASRLQQVLPWIMLVVGVVLGVLWMSWHAPISLVGKSMDTPSKGLGGGAPGAALSPDQSFHVVGFRGEAPRYTPKRQKTGLV